MADWYATFAFVGTGRPNAHLEAGDAADASGLPPPDGVNLWGYINGDTKQEPRDEIVLDHHMFTEESAMNGTCEGQMPFSVPGVPALGALRQGKWKMIVG